MSHNLQHGGFMNHSFFKINLLIFLLFNIIATSLWASDELPIKPPTGIYTHKGQLKARTLRKSKIFLHDDEDDFDMIHSLKKQGYTCIRRSTTQTICQLVTPFTEFPAGANEKTQSLLKGYSIQFPENYTTKLNYDSGPLREWLIYGDIIIGGVKLSVYRISIENTGSIAFSFPVDEENPIGILYDHGSEGLGFPLILQSKTEDGWTLAYYFDALYTAK